MKFLSYLVLSGMVLLAFSCKDDDPKPAAKCSFTFKGTKYTNNAVVCDSENDYNYFTSGSQTTWTIYVNTDGDIAFTNWGSSTPVWYSTYNDGGEMGTVTFTNNTFEFTGTIANDADATDKGIIQGKCTCTE
jgi:hypothetical protein